MIEPLVGVVLLFIVLPAAVGAGAAWLEQAVSEDSHRWDEPETEKETSR